MIKKLVIKLEHIIKNIYLELVFFYMILAVMIIMPCILVVSYSLAVLFRSITGRLLDPLVYFSKRILSFEFFMVVGFIILVFFIFFVIVYRVRNGSLLNSILLYDIFNNYDRSYKTISGVLIPILLMVIYMVYFLSRMYRGGLDYLNSLITISAITISLTMIAYIAQINRILRGINNIGKLDEKLSSYGNFIFTQKALNKIVKTDEDIKKTVEEQLKSERLKTELITNISHDLKTPLTSIINYTDLLKKHEIENQEIKNYIEVLDRNSQRLKVLITDLVYASKAETGNVEIELISLELNELVSQVYGEFDYLFKEKEITFVFDPDADIYVLADSNHLARVLINIMDNAIKYSLEGSRIYASTTVEGEYICFSLKNISKEKLNISPDELMEQFVRGERSRHTEGSGLGLYISRSLMELMEGKLVLSINGDLFEVKLLIPKDKQ